jgi:hypothetical protein
MQTEWFGCYDGSWQSAPLAAEAYAHPAKISFGLAERIYRHMLAEGWLAPGDKVVDPFGGIGGCAFHAALYGLHWTGMELEPKFVDLCRGYTCNTLHLCPACAKNQAELDRQRQHVRDLEAILKTGIQSSGRYDETDATWEPPRPITDAERENYASELTVAQAHLRQLEAKRAVPCAEYQPGNLETWRARYAPHFPGYGTARVLQGDSRRLAEIVAEADAVVSSPPFQGSLQSTDAAFNAEARPGRTMQVASYGTSPGQLGALPPGDFDAALRYDGAIASPPYAGTTGHDGQSVRLDAAEDARRAAEGTARRPGYGATPGQLEQMPPGDYSAAVGSPPYSANTVHGGNGIDTDKLTGNKPGQHSQALTMQGYSACVSSPPYSETRIDGGPGGDEGASGLRDADGNFVRGTAGWEQRKALGARYGATPGQLGAMPAGNGFDATVSSPPYEASVNTGINDDSARQRKAERYAKGEFTTKRPDVFVSPTNIGCAAMFQSNYGDTDGQVGALRADTFWTAAREIVAQTYAVLKPGAVAAWITGDFVRNKQRVPFGEQWLALCESVGFDPLLHVTAWKTTDHGAQLGLLGEDKSLKCDKVSFFRRLANEKNPHAAILNEDVWFVRKPEART